MAESASMPRRGRGGVWSDCPLREDVVWQGVLTCGSSPTTRAFPRFPAVAVRGSCPLTVARPFRTLTGFPWLP